VRTGTVGGVVSGLLAAEVKIRSQCMSHIHFVQSQLTLTCDFAPKMEYQLAVCRFAARISKTGLTKACP
jgi:hypothetical protein